MLDLFDCGAMLFESDQDEEVLLSLIHILANLGGGGLFVGMIVTFIAINVFRFTNNSKFKITMPEQVPPSVARSFEALTPTLIVILIIGSLTYFVDVYKRQPSRWAMRSR